MAASMPSCSTSGSGRWPTSATASRRRAADIALAAGLPADQVAEARRAGELAKVDQGAVLVAEFSDLQGYVGAEYAELEGEPAPVVAAIREHYLPEGPDSPLPSSDVAAAVALADKLDNLVGAFLVGEIPTGSKDPYGLRRAASGIVRVLVDRGWDIDLDPVLRSAAARLAADGTDVPEDPTAALVELDDFIGDRVAFQLSEDGVHAESVAAAHGARLGSIVATVGWARTLDRHRDEERLREIWTASTRLSRLAARGDVPEGRFVPAGDAGEDALAAAVERAAARIAQARDDRDLDAALDAGAPLAAAVDTFFTDVLVNADDPAVRSRRYRLIADAAETFTGIADFTRITDQGGGR